MIFSAARGPAFLLSDKDRMVLNQQLAADAEDPHLDGLISVGWFLSHTRSEITLSDSDLELYSIFFPAPWQVTLIVRPGRGSSMRAGFFVREIDGTVKSENSYLEFNFPDRLAGVLDRAPASRAERVPGERRLNVMPRAEAFQSSTGAVAAARHEAAPQIEIAPPTFGQPMQYLPSPPPKKKWPWLVGWALLVILGAVFGLRYWMLRPVQEPQSEGTCAISQSTRETTDPRALPRWDSCDCMAWYDPIPALPIDVARRRLLPSRGPS